jgi:DNA invertase Pin-like site-specific DNA recombinase
VVAEHYDAATSGSDPVEERAGFKAMLDFLDGDGVRLVLVEDISRFARTVAAQELGLTLMLRRGVQVVAANGDVLTDTDDEARVMIRHVLGAFAQMERTRLVKKLRGARDRASAAAGRRIEGRKPVLAGEALALARKLRRKNPHTGERRSLRTISAVLADAGHATPETGKPFSAEVIRLALRRSSSAPAP